MHKGKALVIGGGGFIGHNLVKRLKKEGWFVSVVDLKKCPYEESPADTYHVADIRSVFFGFEAFDRIYQLAADMGGAGFVFTGENDAEILTNSLSININLLNVLARSKYKGTVLYSSSVCSYPAEVEGKESDAYPANPPSNYGWEKLTSERLYLAYAKKYGLDIRIARFHNTFGPYGTYDGGREKFPAATCRKVAKAEKEIEVWGDGKQERPFIFIEDLLDGIEALMQSDFKEPINLGPDESVTINEMVDLVCEIAGKQLKKKHVEGPTGEQKRQASCQLAKEKLNWKPKTSLKDAFTITYNWINEQVTKS